MTTDADRFLTTHIGSLPRPPALRELLDRHTAGEAVDEAERTRTAEAATDRGFDTQAGLGVVHPEIARAKLEGAAVASERPF